MPTVPRNDPATGAGPPTSPGGAGRSGRVLLLANPRARRGADARELRQPLEELGLEVTFAEPESVDELRHIIETAGATHDRIVIAGGDGTIAAALPALLANGKPLAVLPLGTANDLARNLDLPSSQAAQLAVVAAGKVIEIDLGCANGRLYLNAASVGLGAAAAALHQGPAKRLFGVLNYLRVLYVAYRHIRPFRIDITCDGKRHRGRFVHLGVVNGRFHGGGLEPRPTGSITDGVLDLYALKGGPVFHLLRLLAVLRIRGAASDRIFHLEGRHFLIETGRPRSVNVDGELVEKTPLEITIRPRALAVVAPETARVAGTPGAQATCPSGKGA